MNAASTSRVSSSVFGCCFVHSLSKYHCLALIKFHPVDYCRPMFQCLVSSCFNESQQSICFSLILFLAFSSLLKDTFDLLFNSFVQLIAQQLFPILDFVRGFRGMQAEC